MTIRAGKLTGGKPHQRPLERSTPRGASTPRHNNPSTPMVSSLSTTREATAVQVVGSGVAFHARRQPDSPDGTAALREKRHSGSSPAAVSSLVGAPRRRLALLPGGCWGGEREFELHLL